jgi:hypothetical protein
LRSELTFAERKQSRKNRHSIHNRSNAATTSLAAGVTVRRKRLLSQPKNYFTTENGKRTSI